jgi:hypothetical protein
MGFTSCFQNAENIGQQNLLHINVTHSCPEQLTKFLFRDKKLSLQGWALVNDMAATTHICQILKPLEYWGGGGGGTHIGPPWPFEGQTRPQTSRYGLWSPLVGEGGPLNGFYYFWENISNIFNVGFFIILYFLNI